MKKRPNSDTRKALVAELSAAQTRELDDRLEYLRKHPRSGKPWREVLLRVTESGISGETSNG